ncbi:MAG: hypothetical protein HQL19_00835 [Candidatus Omnitrophica bacterium]|nr:hypothetical protein [Candidatus Omnitrophota bacterium]
MPSDKPSARTDKVLLTKKTMRIKVDISFLIIFPTINHKSENAGGPSALRHQDNTAQHNESPISIIYRYVKRKGKIKITRKRFPLKDRANKKALAYARAFYVLLKDQQPP